MNKHEPVRVLAEPMIVAWAKKGFFKTITIAEIETRLKKVKILFVLRSFRTIACYPTVLLPAFHAPVTLVTPELCAKTLERPKT